MNQPGEHTRRVVIERVFAHPPEALWRAITDPALLTQWLLKNDFVAELGRSFRFQNDPVRGWDGVIECQVLALDPVQRLVYSWRAFGLESVVEFTLTPTQEGTKLRLEHSGFQPDQEAAYQGAQHGWQRFLGNLEHLLAEGI